MVQIIHDWRHERSNIRRDERACKFLPNLFGKENH